MVGILSPGQISHGNRSELYRRLEVLLAKFRPLAARGSAQLLNLVQLYRAAGVTRSSPFRMLAAVVVRASRVPLLRRAGSPGRHLPSSLARRVGSLALALPRMTVAPPKGLGSSNFTCASASLRWGVPRRCVCSGSAVDSASKPSRAERRRRDREQTKIRRGRADESPTLSAADTASRTLWESEPVLFESSRAGLVRLLSALSITQVLIARWGLFFAQHRGYSGLCMLQAGGWTWFAATSYGPMAVPQYAAEGAFQMSYGLTAALLTVSYGFLAGVWFYARHYVCRLRICNRKERYFARPRAICL
jgi:hypothetical protein